MKVDVDFEKISNEIQKRIDFVIEQASKNPEINIENSVEAAKIAKLVCIYSLKIYTDELREIFLNLSQNSTKQSNPLFVWKGFLGIRGAFEAFFFLLFAIPSPPSTPEPCPALCLQKF